MSLRNRKRYFGVLLIALLLFGCASAGRKKADPSPAEVLDQFIGHIFTGAGEPAYALLSARAQAEVPKDEFVRLVSLFDPEKFIDVLKEFAEEEVSELGDEKFLEFVKVIWQLVISAIHMQAGEETIKGEEAIVELIIEYPDPDKLTEFEKQALFKEGMAIYLEIMDEEYDIDEIREKLVGLLGQMPRSIDTETVHMIREEGGWRVDFNENFDKLRHILV